jgi:hypothetical protein
VHTVGRLPVGDAGAGAVGGAAPKEYRTNEATFHAVPPARVRPPPATLLPLVPAPGVGPPALPHASGGPALVATGPQEGGANKANITTAVGVAVMPLLPGSYWSCVPAFPKPPFPRLSPRGPQWPYPILCSLSAERKNKGHFCARASEACPLQ